MNGYEPTILLLRCNLLFHPVTAEKRIRDAAKYCKMGYSAFIRTAIVDRLAEVEAAMEENEACNPISPVHPTHEGRT